MAAKVYNIEDYFTPGELDAVDDTKYDEVEVPEWGDKKVLLGSLKTDQILAFVAANADPTKQRIAGVSVLVDSMMIPTGPDTPPRRLATPENRDTYVKQLLNRDYNVINRLCERCLVLNGMDTKKQAELKNVSGETVPDASPIA